MRLKVVIAVMAIETRFLINVLRGAHPGVIHLKSKRTEMLCFSKYFINLLSIYKLLYILSFEEEEKKKEASFIIIFPFH